MADIRSVLVIGATGNQGSSVIEALLAAGHHVRALTRNVNSPAAQGLAQRKVEVVAGDFLDADALQRAATGADTVYAMTTPSAGGPGAEVPQGILMANAAKAAGVGHFIFGSVADADRDTGVPHFDSKYEVENHVAGLGIAYTISAPVYFMDNLIAPWSLPALAEGRVTLAMPPDRPLQQIALSNIGAFVAALVDRREAVFGQRYNIAGDELSGDESVSVLSKTIGREITYEGFPADALAAENEDMALMFAWFNDVGYSADIDGLHRDFRDVPWLRFDGWARTQDWDTLLETAT